VNTSGRRVGLAIPALRIAVASGLIAALAILARPASESAGAPLVEAPFVPTTAASSAASPAPSARFGLAEPGSDPVKVLAARIDLQTGQREDVLVRGDFAAIDGPALRVTLTRGPSAGFAPGLFVLMARRAAGGPMIGAPALAVLRTGARGRIPTKFGAVETLDVTLVGTTGRTCTGFVTREAIFRIDGWLCSPLGRSPETRTLGCMIDGLSLVDLADPDTMMAFSATAWPERACRTTAAADAIGRTGSIISRAQSRK
jgi:hypothetical protein